MDATKHSDCKCYEKDRVYCRNGEPHHKRKNASVGSLYVDDANLVVWGDRKEYKDVGKLYKKVKATSKAWACLLIATGGALKPVK